MSRPLAATLRRLRTMSAEDLHHVRREVNRLLAGRASELRDRDSRKVLDAIRSTCRECGVRRTSAVGDPRRAAVAAATECAALLREHGPRELSGRLLIVRRMARYEIDRIRDRRRDATEYEVCRRLSDPRAVCEEMWPGYIAGGVNLGFVVEAGP